MGFGTFLKRLTGIQAYQDCQKSKEIVERAEENYRVAREETVKRKNALNKLILDLTQLRLKSVKDVIGTFILNLKDMQQVNKDKEYDFLESINIKNEALQRMEELHMSASNILKTTIASGTVGAIALTGIPVAVTSTVGALAAASTGTAIAELSGVAATNATLAWLGGGSLAAGGGGMAAGATVLAGISVGVTGLAAICMAGMIASAHYSKKLTAAKSWASEVGKTVAKMERGWAVMDGIGKRVDELKTLTAQIHDRAIKELKYLAPLVSDFETNVEYQIETFQRVGLLVKSAGDLATVPIIDSNGELAEGFQMDIGRIKKIFLSQATIH